VAHSPAPACYRHWPWLDCAPGWLEMMMGMEQLSSPFSTRISRSYRQWSSLLRGQRKKNRQSLSS